MAVNAANTSLIAAATSSSGSMTTLSVVVVDQPDGQRDAQLAAAGGGPLGLVHPAGQPVELCLAHLALEAQQEPVVDVGQVIDAVVVDDQGVGQAGQLQQAGQVRVGAGKPGDLQPEHRPDLAQAHPGDQVLEPVPVAGAAPGQAQVGVDHLDVAGGPAQPGRLRRPGRTGAAWTRCARGPASGSTGGRIRSPCARGGRGSPSARRGSPPVTSIAGSLAAVSAPPASADPAMLASSATISAQAPAAAGDGGGSGQAGSIG